MAPVFLYQTQQVQRFPAAISFKIQFEDPFRTIPLPSAFFAIVPVSSVALNPFGEESNHVPEPLYVVA
jgi:hypothetical protein